MRLHAAGPCEPLSTADFIFSPLLGFWSVIYQLDGHWGFAGKWHFKDSPPPRWSQIKDQWLFHNTADWNHSKTSTFLNFCTWFRLVVNTYPEFGNAFLCLKHIEYGLPNSTTYKSPDLELQSSNLHFCNVICQSAPRRHRGVSLISSATCCCHLQSTPWWCKEENKPKLCLLIYWDSSNTTSFKLL